ncbi:polysaccharide pyruvyl transferase family protein [Pseudoroseomonas globiformis]|uniref:Polysaccharide pyruvyl transferase family protein n=1 Tax=Teichococcus globiformis TaxID=2307229 RepID=A0ABV7G2I4_9PROT
MPRPPFAAYRFWNGVPNNGDTITAELIRDLVGTQPFLVPGNRPHVLGVGSIMFMANQNSYVWGSGVIDPSTYTPDLDAKKVRAVRGTLTRDWLHSRGIKIGDVPQGDAGSFIAALPALRHLAGRRPRYRAAIIPHWASAWMPVFKKLSHTPEIVMVEMRDSSMKPIEQIADADIVISQSLHGLIYAEALGKPTLWISQTDDDKWCFKYRDWYSNVRNAPNKPMLLDKFDEAAFREARRRDITVDQWAMLSAFPRQEVAFDPGHEVVTFEEARRLSPSHIVNPALLPEGLFNARDEPEHAKQIEAALASFAATAYGHWAEPPFCYITRSAMPVGGPVFAAMQQLLYTLHDVDVICIASKADLEKRGDAPLAPFKVAEREFAKGVALIGGGVFCRPGKFNLRERIGTIFI